MWQDISTAPKDGRKILICLHRGGEYIEWPETVFWDCGYWIAAIDGQQLLTKFTHWMPLPETPLKDENND